MGYLSSRRDQPLAGCRPAIAGALLLLAACAGEPPTTPPAPLRAYIPNEPASLNFVKESDASTRWVGKLIAETLVAFDRDLNVVPRLAASWEASPDGRVVTFRLRDGVRWHDGRPFTAHDVVFTLDRVLDPDSLVVGKRVYFDTVVSHRAVDDLTYRIERDEPYARAVEVFDNLPILPAHLYEGQDFAAAPANRAPVGTGPYRFVSWESGGRITLERFDDYHGTRPGIERIVFRPMPDPNTRLEALLAGQLDMTSLRPLDLERLEGDPALAERVRVLRQNSLYVLYIAWNVNHPLFGDHRVRQAMTLALDRNGFVEHVLMGNGRVATSLVHPSMWAFDDGLEPWPYDPAAAGERLDEAGWTDTDGDGWRDRDGTPFRFTLLVPMGNREVGRLAALLQESLRTLAVDMQIRTMEYNLFSEERDARNFAAYINGWRLDPDPDCYDFWHSSQIGGDGLNYAGYIDAEVDRLCEEARRVVDPQVRAAAYRQVQALLHRDQPNTFVAYRQSLVGVSTRLQGLETSPLGAWAWYPGPILWHLDNARGEAPAR